MEKILFVMIVLIWTTVCVRAEERSIVLDDLLTIKLPSIEKRTNDNYYRHNNKTVASSGIEIKIKKNVTLGFAFNRIINEAKPRLGSTEYMLSLQFNF
jgi:hypothetical protein